MSIYFLAVGWVSSRRRHSAHEEHTGICAGEPGGFPKSYGEVEDEICDLYIQASPMAADGMTVSPALCLSASPRRASPLASRGRPSRPRSRVVCRGAG